jgi:hypothetical protein
MKHIAIFEDFSSGGDQTKITIEFENENPDAVYGATVEGVGKTPSEAALMALAAGWKYCIDGEDRREISSPEEAYEILDSVYTNKSDYEKDIIGLTTDQLEPDLFGDHGTTCSATSDMESVRNQPIGGFIVSGFFNDYNSGESGEF